MLPARGPRPKLKSEEVVTLRLMEDVEVPQLRSFSWYQNPTTQSGGTLSGYRSFSQSSTATTPAVPVNNPQVAQSRSAFAASTQQDSSTLTLIALKSQAIYAASDYWVDGANIAYVLPDGSRGVADLRDVDWQRTTDLNVERHVRVTLRRQPASVIYAAAR